MPQDIFRRPSRHTPRAWYALTGEELCCGQTVSLARIDAHEDPSDWYAYAVLIGMSMDKYYVSE